MENIHLVSWTPDPIAVMFWAFRNMHNEIDPTTVEYPITEQQKIQFLKVLSKIPHQTVLEYVKFTFYINGSRAFQQQLTRSRKSAYSIQSLRIVDVGNFADINNYHTPPDADIPEYHQAMKAIQGLYRVLKNKMSIESARGVLPLNINSPITWSVDLRELVHVLELRFCKNAQYEFRQTASKIKNIVAEKVDKDLAEILFKPHCQQFGYCNSPVPCELVTKHHRYETALHKADIDSIKNIGIQG